MVQAVKVEQVVVQAEVVLAWGVLVSEMEEQTVEGFAAGKLQMCHHRETPPYAVSVTAFLLQNHPTLHHHPLKTPRHLVPPQGFPGLPFDASWLGEESAPSCSSSSF